jgi:hypothetical protein
MVMDRLMRYQGEPLATANRSVPAPILDRSRTTADPAREVEGRGWLDAIQR